MKRQHASISSKIKNANKKIVGLKSEEKELAEIIERSEANMINMIHKESKIDKLIKGNYSVIDTKVKSYMDATRVNASNMFRNLHDKFRQIRNNFRDDHFWLRQVTQCSAVVTNVDQKVVLELWLPSSFQPHIIKEMQTLVNSYCTAYNEANKQNENRLIIKLTQGVIHT